MTREQKCKLALEKGFSYNPINGIIYNKNKIEYKNKHNRGYISIALYHNKKEYRLLGHQFAWYVINNETVDCIDHINGITDDNRINNLRSVTQQENNFNQKKAKGFYYNKRNKNYNAQIRFNNKNIYLGAFKNEYEARNAYLKAKEKYHTINK